MSKNLVFNIVAAASSVVAITMSLFVSGCSPPSAEQSPSSSAADPGSGSATPSAVAEAATNPASPADSSGSSRVRSSAAGGSHVRIDSFGGSAARSAGGGGGYVRIGAYGGSAARMGAYGGSARGFPGGQFGSSLPLDRQLDNLEQRTDEAERRLNQLIETMQKK